MEPMNLRLLLLEDDAVSRAFLTDALAALPARVDAAETIARASDLVLDRPHDLWLIDAHLPDGDGVDALTALQHLSPGVPALAITAELHRDGFDQLCAAGFLEVLQKPIAIAALHAAVQRALTGTTAFPATPATGKLPVWDEQRALAALGGRRESLQALRALFLDELPHQSEEVLAACAANDADAARAVLHQLKAGCGFVGATRLLAAVEALSRSPLDGAQRRLFEFAVADQLATIEVTGDREA